MRTRNVTRAADNLGMSQSAVSQALKRLREQFGDEILTRVGRTMVITQFADAMMPTVELSLSNLESLLVVPHFDPADIDREFVIATADTIVLAMGSVLVDRLAQEAPRARIQVVDLRSVDIRSLKSGELDFVILPRLSELQADGLHEFFLYEEEFVCIARADHPDIDSYLTLADQQRLTSVSYRSDQHSDLFTSPHGLEGDQLRVPDFFMLILLVERSNAIAFVQRHIAERFVNVLNIAIVDAEIRTSRVAVHAYWAALQHNDSAHRWLRATIQDIARQPAGRIDLPPR